MITIYYLQGSWRVTDFFSIFYGCVIALQLIFLLSTWLGVFVPSLARTYIVSHFIPDYYIFKFLLLNILPTYSTAIFNSLFVSPIACSSPFLVSFYTTLCLSKAFIISRAVWYFHRRANKHHWVSCQAHNMSTSEEEGIIMFQASGSPCRKIHISYHTKRGYGEEDLVQNHILRSTRILSCTWLKLRTEIIVSELF